MNSGQNTLLIAGSIIATGIVIALGIILAGSGSGGAINADGGNGGNVNFDIIPVSQEDHIRGNLDAQVVMVEYSDVGCIHCQNLHGVLNQVVDQYSADEFAWVFRHFPLRAPGEAHAAECVAELEGEDTFWSYLDELMAQAQRTTPDGDTDRLADLAATMGVDRDAFVACQEGLDHENRVQEFANDARDAGASGTPFNVFVTQATISEDAQSQIESILGARMVISKDRDMMIIPGGLPFDMLTAVIDSLLGN